LNVIALAVNVREWFKIRLVQIRMINHHKIVLKNAVKCFFLNVIKMVFLNVIKMVFILYRVSSYIMFEKR